MVCPQLPFGVCVGPMSRGVAGVAIPESPVHGAPSKTPPPGTALTLQVAILKPALYGSIELRQEKTNKKTRVFLLSFFLVI